MIKAEKRKKVFALTNGLCWYCGIAVADGCDHKIAISKGGSDALNNLLPACKKCNAHKMCLNVEEYRALILNKLVKSTHIQRMRDGGFFEEGKFFGER